MKQWWNVELEGKPDFEESMKRIYAWYDSDIIDRPPVRFHRHNEQFSSSDTIVTESWSSLKERWMDADYQVNAYLSQIKDKVFRGETFPVFEPNLGPNVYAAMHGGELEFGEVTSWYHPIITNEEDMRELTFSKNHEYFKKLEELTAIAVDKCRGKSLVAYTDLHPGVDCAAAWRGNDKLCMDFYDKPHFVKELMNRALENFSEVYRYFDKILKAAKLPSVCWMNIPDFGTLHIPSNDFSAMIGPQIFNEFCIPIHKKEMHEMSRNIFHVDGPGVARHIDEIITLPNLSAVQWVQGVGDDYPIMQWVPFIKKLQKAKVPIIVDVALKELENFCNTVNPEGIFLWIGTESEEEEIEVLNRLHRWNIS